MPTTGQLILLLCSLILFAIGGGISGARAWRDGEALRITAKACMYGGIVLAVGVILWHALQRDDWLPITDNFEALTWLAVLLALLVMYMQRAHPVLGLEWFVMPIVVLLLLAAALFGLFEFKEYPTFGNNAWNWVHRVTAYGGAVAFAIAAALGAMYIIASRRLRTKTAGVRFTSLERLERLTMLSVTLGFALLTVGLLTGLVRMLDDPRGAPVPKILLASLAWLVYAVVLHAPINPRLRGRRAAMLSVFGFILMAGTLIVVQFVPGGQG